MLSLCQSCAQLCALSVTALRALTVLHDPRELHASRGPSLDKALEILERHKVHTQSLSGTSSPPC